MRIMIYGRAFEQKHTEHLQVLIDVLKDREIETALYRPYFKSVSDQIDISTEIELISNHQEFKEWTPDFLISLGGDGTILNSARIVKGTGTPCMGINFGRLGFLSSVETHQIVNAIDYLIAGNYNIIKRTMLYLESNLPVFGEDRFALNEMTILKRDNSSMITIKTYVNGEYLTSYWGDGVIVASPTGSTAYSLSCGGPIIFPNSGNFVLTPVAPHNLSMRPIILNDNSVISFEIEGRADTYLCTLDGRFETVTAAHQLAVRKCDYHFGLVQLPGQSFLTTMRDKLTWGKDKRN